MIYSIYLVSNSGNLIFSKVILQEHERGHQA